MPGGEYIFHTTDFLGDNHIIPKKRKLFLSLILSKYLDYLNSQLKAVSFLANIRKVYGFCSKFSGKMCDFTPNY